MSDYGHIGRVAKDTIGCLTILSCMTCPLAVWKAVDLILWLIAHVRIG